MPHTHTHHTHITSLAIVPAIANDATVHHATLPHCATSRHITPHHHTTLCHITTPRHFTSPHHTMSNIHAAYSEALALGKLAEVNHTAERRRRAVGEIGQARAQGANDAMLQAGGAVGRPLGLVRGEHGCQARSSLIIHRTCIWLVLQHHAARHASVRAA